MAQKRGMKEGVFEKIMNAIGIENLPGEELEEMAAGFLPERSPEEKVKDELFIEIEACNLFNGIMHTYKGYHERLEKMGYSAVHSKVISDRIVERAGEYGKFWKMSEESHGSR